MLVLSRKKNETIVVTAPDGTRLVLTVVQIRGDKARIGIDAPKDYAVHRGEIQELVDNGYKSQ
jgi:carbon storage regulator